MSLLLEAFLEAFLPRELAVPPPLEPKYVSVALVFHGVAATLVCTLLVTIDLISSSAAASDPAGWPLLQMSIVAALGGFLFFVNHFSIQLTSAECSRIQDFICRQEKAT